MPYLLKASKYRQWVVVDAEDNKPMFFLGTVLDFVGTRTAQEIRHRNDIDKVLYSIHVPDLLSNPVEPKSAKCKDDFCCVC